MNVATRLSAILSKIKVSKKPNAFQTFEEVFNVEGCISLSGKLLICEKQIDKMENKDADIRLITFLRRVFDCKSLARNIDSEKKSIDGFIIALNTVAPYMPVENIDKKAITELADALEVLRAKIDKLDSIEEHDSEILYSFVNEMRRAVDDIDIGGIEAFMGHTEVASGKILIHHDSFKKGDIMEETANIFTKATDIINNSQTWLGVIGWVGDKILK